MDIQNTEQVGSHRHHRPWFGLIIIAVGGMLLADNLGYDLGLPRLKNWWAPFLLIPAAGKLNEAWSNHRAGLDISHASVRSPLVSGLACLLVAAMFLLSLSWPVWWPLFVILGGLWLLVS